MAQKTEITAADGHVFDVYRADPAGQAKGGIIILHAIYGLTTHIGDVCDQWASEGYAAIGPSLFDRTGRGSVYGYDPAGGEAGMQHYAKLTQEGVLADVAACSSAFGDTMPKIISGFCTGGTWAWKSSAYLPFDAQVNFYGSHVLENLDVVPKCPTVMHYGDSDHIVDVPGIEKIKAAHPDVLVHVYPGGGHAFFNPEQQRYNREAAAQTWRNSLAFLDGVLAG